MHKLLRLYNQNRLLIWISILIIVFVIIIINVFNKILKQSKVENQNDNEQVQEQLTANTYAQESRSIISEENVKSKYRDYYGEVIDEFYTLCINHNPEDAYDLLSDEMKMLEYPTEEIFEKLYYNSKFEGNKQFSFQSWITGDINIYIVKIFENMLESGKSSNTEAIEDYVTIVPYGDKYKLNINSYVQTIDINKSSNNDIINIKAKSADLYMDYAIYTFEVKNNTDNTIFLDSRKTNDTIYLSSGGSNRFVGLLYENNDEEFKLEPKQFKTIKIKFNISYRLAIIH